MGTHGGGVDGVGGGGGGGGGVGGSGGGDGGRGAAGGASWKQIVQPIWVTEPSDLQLKVVPAVTGRLLGKPPPCGADPYGIYGPYV